MTNNNNKAVSLNAYTAKKKIPKTCPDMSEQHPYSWPILHCESLIALKDEENRIKKWKNYISHKYTSWTYPTNELVDSNQVTNVLQLITAENTKSSNFSVNV